MSGADMLTGGIIGFGNIAAEGHVPGYRYCRGARIVAAFDPDESRAKALEGSLPDARFFSDIDEFFEKNSFDFVDIATPPAFHAPYIIQALERGLHVLCEKPLVLDLDQLEAIRGLSRAKGRVVFTVHNWRHSPVIKEVSRLLSGKDEEGLGRIRRIRYEVIRMRPSVAVGEGSGQADGPDNWRLDPAVAGGGILVDHGWHAFYIVNGWLGGEPRWVEGRLENRKFKEIAVEDTAEVTFGYPDGAVAELFFTWAGDERRNSIAIEADGGRRMLVLDDHIVCEEAGPGGCGRKVLKSFSEGLSHGSHHPDWYGAVVQEFLDEVQGRTRPGRNLIQASSCLKMLLGAAEAAKSGRRIEL